LGRAVCLRIWRHPGAPASAVLAWLAAQGHTLSHLASDRANLEDVFLALTGRQLRD